VVEEAERRFPNEERVTEEYGKMLEKIEINN